MVIECLDTPSDIGCLFSILRKPCTCLSTSSSGTTEDINLFFKIDLLISIRELGKWNKFWLRDSDHIPFVLLTNIYEFNVWIFLKNLLELHCGYFLVHRGELWNEFFCEEHTCKHAYKENQRETLMEYNSAYSWSGTETTESPSNTKEYWSNNKFLINHSFSFPWEMPFFRKEWFWSIF